MIPNKRKLNRLPREKSPNEKLRKKLLRLVTYSTVYLVLNLTMQFIIAIITQLADSHAMSDMKFRNYFLVALNMFITASLYSGILSNVEGGLERLTSKIVQGFHKFSKAFIGVIGSLLFIYYLLFAAYYWNIFGQSIMPLFVRQGWHFLWQYFDLYVIQTIQGWLGF